MQIQTPKKYRGVQRRNVIGCRRLLFNGLLLALIAAGIAIALNHERLAPGLQTALYDGIRQLEARAATLAAPAPTPTADPSNRLIEASNYWRQGALNEATALYQQLAPSLPNTVEIYRRIALGMINGGRYEEAALYGSRAINADPFNADAWAIRAWALDWAGQAAEALPNARRALELAPENSRAQAYLAEIYLSLGQPERGEALLNELLAAQPASAEAYRARGLIKQQHRYDFQGALDDFQTAYNLAEHINLFAIDIAIVEIGLRNYEAALGLLNDVVEANPSHEAALQLLGNVYWRAYGDPAQAQRYLQNCVDYNAENVNCHFWLGYMQNRLGATADAAAAFARAIELGSQNAQHYFWAGSSQIALGDCDRALQYLLPGLRLALASEDQRFAADIEDIIPQCDPTFIRQTAAGGG